MRNRLPNNVIYKMLEKYYYFEFINKLKEIIGDDRKLSDKEADSLMSVGEALDRDSTIVFAFGRFNPPTIGHAKLMNTVKQVARRERANHQVFASASSDPRKNPLDQSSKIKFMKKMFKGTNIKAAGGNQRTFMEILKTYDRLYGKVIMIAGSDRINEFQKLADKYNGKDYNFKSVKIESAGERDPDADGATGMSASKMRDAAKNDDLKSFTLGVKGLLSDKDIKDLYNSVRKGMGIREGIESFADYLNNDIREDYIKDKIFNIGDMVENIENGTSGMVIRRGPNYVVYETDEQEVKKAWLYDLVESTKEESNAYNETDQPNGQTSQSSNFAPVHNGESYELDRLLRELDEDTKAERSETQTERYENADEFIEELELEFFSGNKLLDILKGMTVDRAKVRYGVNIFKKKVTAAKDKFKLAADIAQEVGIGPREFQNILQSLKILPESYGIGTIEYAKHAFELTPGQSIKNYKKITNQVSKKDIKEWADEESTIDKYKERYKRSWKSELKKSVARMLDEI